MKRRPRLSARLSACPRARLSARLSARRSVPLTALSLAAVLVLAGCGGDEPTPSGESPESPSAQASEEPAVSPLTGLEVEGRSPDHPVLVTKIDNTASSAPQRGLGSADMVVEELVEGGTTRLAAFFYSDLPDEVGPVRSMRASDVGIVAPAEATVVTSGAAGVTIQRIKAAGIPFYGEGAPGVYRDDARSAPYNLFADLVELAKTTKGPREPEPYFDFGSAKDLPRGPKASTVSANFGNHTSTWALQKGSYVNTNSRAAEGDRFDADTLLVLRVKVGDAGYKDPAGYPVPETKFEGKGEALLFHGGKVVKGTWSKDGLEGHLTLSAKGKEIAVPAGHTWVELVPAVNGDVSYGR